MPKTRPLIYTWKEKILDYEIETPKSVESRHVACSWKEKILDYEIETDLFCRTGEIKVYFDTWKEKILDYEIETTFSSPASCP